MGHDYEKEIKCPYCDYDYSDSWEHNEDDGEILECNSCGREFELTVDVSVTYCTAKVNCDDRNPPEEHEFGPIFDISYDQETTDRYNKEKFLNKDDHMPHTTWSRNCVKCDEVEYIDTEIGGECPWKS